MAKSLTIRGFMQMFPDDAACMKHLFRMRYGADFKCPSCGGKGKFYKLSKRPVYACRCGEQISPMVGTPFYRTHISLQKWFYAMYLFTTTQQRVSAKELQRQLGVRYKTACRMSSVIRKYLALVDGNGPTLSKITVDERGHH
jgi:Transposase zinc-ribbon domain